MFRGMPILQKLRVMSARAKSSPTIEDLSPAASVPAPAERAPGEFGFDLGVKYISADDYEAGRMPEVASFIPALDGHLLVTGEPGCGKRVLLAALAGETVDSMDVHTVDMWGTLSREGALQPKGAASTGFTPTECALMLEGVRAEVERRVQRCAAEGVEAFKDLQDSPRRILVLLRDSNHLLVEPEISTDGHPYREAKERSVECIKEIARSAATAGVTFVFASYRKGEESGIPAELLAESLSTLELTQRSYEGLDGGRRVVCNDGVYRAAGGPEVRLAMKDRKAANPGA